MSRRRLRQDERKLVAVAVPVATVAVPVAVAGTSRQRRKRVRETGKYLGKEGSEYTTEQINFMMALDRYKRRKSLVNPTCCQILDVVHELGYRLM